MSDVASSGSKCQQEAIQFNQPASEASQAQVAALANYLREIIQPIGSVDWSMLDEATYQAQTTNPTPQRWVLADGRDVTGSAYQSLTGNTNIPDLRSVFVRGKDNGRGINANGDQTLGSFTEDAVGYHKHTETISANPYFGTRALPNFGKVFLTDTGNPHDLDLTSDGSEGLPGMASETFPKYVTLNPFIRIN